MKNFAARIVNQHKSNDPFVISHNLGIKIIEEPLGKVKGYYDGFIHVNSTLPKWQKHHTVAYHLFSALTESEPDFLVYKNSLNEQDLARAQNMFAVALLPYISSFDEFREKAQDYDVSNDELKTLYARYLYIQGLLGDSNGEG